MLSEEIKSDTDHTLPLPPPLQRSQPSMSKLGKASSVRVIKMKPRSTSKAKFKVVFLGDITVGKTSFISRFLYGSFNSSYQPTIGIDFLSHNLNVDGKFVRLQIWDTAGQERFRSLIPSYIRDAAIVYVMYDITCRATFLNCRDWVEKAREEGGENSLIILLGNKVDLEEDREVQVEEGESLAKELGLHFIEASAKSGIHVKSSFVTAASKLTVSDDAEDSAGDEEILNIKLTKDQLVLQSTGTKGSCLC